MGTLSSCNWLSIKMLAIVSSNTFTIPIRDKYVKTNTRAKHLLYRMPVHLPMQSDQSRRETAWL